MSRRHATLRRTKTKITAAVGVLTMLFGALLVFAPGAGAANNDTQEWTLTYVGLTVADGDSTFRYQLTRTPVSASEDDNKLSHMVVDGFCAEPLSVSPSFTRNEGQKWDSADLVKSGDFYDITFSGDYTGAVDPSGSTWTLKKGNGEFSQKVITTSGPDCDTTPPCDPQTDPNQCEEPCDPQTDPNQCEEPCDPQTDPNQCEEPCDPQTDPNQCEEPCDPQTDPNQCEEPCDPQTDPNQCEEPCDPQTDPNQCTPPATCVELGTCPPPPPPPAAEIDDATLTIAKVVTGDDLDEWTFGFDGDLDAFVLTDDADSKSFEDLDPGKYTVTETDAGLATFDDIECDDDASVVIDHEEAMVTVDLSEGDDVTCTFINDYELEILPEETPPTAETPPVKAPQAKAPQAKAPQAKVPPANAPAAKTVTPEAEVLGEAVTRTLPRTGSSSTGNLATAGIALMLFGAALVGGSRRLQMVR